MASVLILLASINALAKSVLALIKPDPNLAADIVPVAIFESVTAPSFIAAVTTLPAAIFAAVTAPAPIVLVTILPEAIACCVIIPDAKAVLAAIPPAATSVAFTAPVAISAAPTAPSTIFVFATELLANPSNLILDKPPILVLLFYLSIYPKAMEKANESATDPN